MPRDTRCLSTGTWEQTGARLEHLLHRWIHCAAPALISLSVGTTHPLRHVQ